MPCPTSPQGNNCLGKELLSEKLFWAPEKDVTLWPFDAKPVSVLDLCLHESLEGEAG
eukprot:CAMPEP_0197904390 /NCGR_PEP_ID=MMETSP1439-20131203/57976_1 /TAXON_ID=66791 /ORGANISM="Gonyaulax spinifera, Strain CCMP409" /LENGTH=56 /DNA_ID=CAMNT_0043525575 /DNA_START=46 /DNA_END=212 /DNA_ORIENTATION=-